jgi:asparagine synthase (glutamine-hydrolysing)
MSAIGGIWWTADAPGIEERRFALDRLHASLARRGPDGGAVQHLGAVGMSFRACHTTAEARSERQPLATAGGLLMAFDGRLDNREELLRTLRPPEGSAATDSELVLAAYERWQHRCPDLLIGDYAFAVWDTRRRELLLARDPMGTRPLFYHAGGDLLAWSSTLTALLAAASLPCDLDEEWIAGFLTDCYPQGRTPYRAIRCVPPGHILVAQEGGLRLIEFWRPDMAATGDLARETDAELEERFATILREAVRCRLRAEGPIGAELSGGLDSSSIVCLATDLLAKRQADAPALLTVSYVFDESPTADERRYIRAVEAQIGRTGHHIPQERHRMFASLNEPPAEFPCVLQCTWDRDLEAIRFIRSAGGRVLLSGLGGDELLWSEIDVPLELSDHLRACRWRELARGLQQWSVIQRRPLALLFAETVRALLGPRAPRRLPTWIAPSFARRLRLPWHERPGASQPTASLPPSRREHCAAVSSAIAVTSWMYDSGPEPIELRFPFLDRRLVELCLSLPISQFARGPETRSLHRRALRGLLPPEIVHRRTKVTPAEGLLRDFAAHWPELRSIFPRPLCCQLGFIDEQALQATMTEVRSGLGQKAAHLLRVISLEFWLRSIRT